MPTARSTAATTSSRAGQQRSIARPFASYGLAWPDTPRGLAHPPPIRYFSACPDEWMRLLGPRRGPRAPDARRKDGVPSYERRHPPDAPRRVPGTARNIRYWFRTPRECRAQMLKIRRPAAEANNLPCGLMDAAQVADCLRASKASVLRLIEQQKILAGSHKYQSRLFLSSRKSNSPMVRIPSSSMRGCMTRLTTTIFLKLSSAVACSAACGRWQRGRAGARSRAPRTRRLARRRRACRIGPGRRPA